MLDPRGTKRIQQTDKQTKISVSNLSRQMNSLVVLQSTCPKSLSTFVYRLKHILLNPLTSTMCTLNVTEQTSPTPKVRVLYESDQRPYYPMKEFHYRQCPQHRKLSMHHCTTTIWPCMIATLVMTLWRLAALSARALQPPPPPPP